MRKFKFAVSLMVEVEAFDHLDAEEIIRDTFGLGEDCGLTIVESEVGDFVEQR